MSFAIGFILGVVVGVVGGIALFLYAMYISLRGPW